MPVLRELERRGIHFSGCLYAGLMLTADGPRVLEFNVRFGDPETQAVRAAPRRRPRCERSRPRPPATPPASMRASRRGAGARHASCWPRAATRRRRETGVPIDGVERGGGLPGVIVFHAGTALRGGRLVTAGGRVLAVSAARPDARRRPASGPTPASELIAFDGAQRRTDIALAAAEGEAARA